MSAVTTKMATIRIKRCLRIRKTPFLIWNIIHCYELVITLLYTKVTDGGNVNDCKRPFSA